MDKFISFLTKEQRWIYIAREKQAETFAKLRPNFLLCDGRHDSKVTDVIIYLNEKNCVEEMNFWGKTPKITVHIILDITMNGGHVLETVFKATCFAASNPGRVHFYVDPSFIS